VQEALHGGAHKLAVQVRRPLHCCMAVVLPRSCFLPPRPGIAVPDWPY
jgi:hypothetical protein